MACFTYVSLKKIFCKESPTGFLVPIWNAVYHELVLNKYQIITYNMHIKYRHFGANPLPPIRLHPTNQIGKMMSFNDGPGFQPTPGRWKKRLDELGVHWRFRADESAYLKNPLKELKERLKELNCLFAISQLVAREGDSLEDLLARIVDVLPPSWQYPEIACARIILGDRSYDSLYFQESSMTISAPIIFQGEVAGKISVFYTKPSPQEDEGPFLREERHLIDAVAERLGHIATRKYVETRLEESNRQLATEKTALREANTALREVMARIEEEKTEIQQNILDNVRKILLPIVNELAMSGSAQQKDYLALLEENLEQIASPFVRQLSLEYGTLTTTEVRICDMIRSGLGSKEIAQLRGVSPATISRHREHIRHKLGIANTKVNLTTYLQSTM